MSTREDTKYHNIIFFNLTFETEDSVIYLKWCLFCVFVKIPHSISWTCNYVMTQSHHPKKCTDLAILKNVFWQSKRLDLFLFSRILSWSQRNCSPAVTASQKRQRWEIKKKLWGCWAGDNVVNTDAVLSVLFNEIITVLIVWKHS